MNALAAKLSIFSALVLAAAACTEMEPGSEAEPELGSDSAALLAGGTTWSAHISVPAGGAGWRYGAPTGFSATASAVSDVWVLTPPTTVRQDRLRVELSNAAPVMRRVELHARVSGQVFIITACTIPALQTVCTTEAQPVVAADSPIGVAIYASGPVLAETEALVSWTFHEE